MSPKPPLLEKLVVTGGARLEGTVDVSASKNAALPILAATLLTSDKCSIPNAPNLRDIRTMGALLMELGCEVSRDDKSGLVIHPRDLTKNTATYGLVSQMRASISVLGPLVAMRGEAKVSFPGGCVIGQRPVDLHLKGLRALGADIDIAGGYIEAKAKRLKGGKVYMGGPFGSTVLGTANVMSAATLAKGTTVIECAACEPEIVDLAECLIAMGARIFGAGSPTVTIEGVERLKGFRHNVIPDRIEAGTFLIGAAMTGGDVTVKGANVNHLGALVDLLERLDVEVKGSRRQVRAVGQAASRPVDVVTLPYPGFPTDLQAQMVSLLSRADGISVVTEKIYPERFMHVPELARMGADIRKEGPSVIVHGVDELSGTTVMASDLRASAALVLAGLVAKGHTEVLRAYHIDRGYENIEQKMQGLGATVTREMYQQEPSPSIP